MSIFERYLSVWVLLCIVIGAVWGNLNPGIYRTIATIEWAHVNLVVAVLIWLMVFPMMVQIDFASVKGISKRPKGIFLTVIVNWLIKPFTMAALGWLFFKVIFVPLVDPVSADEYISGMILLGIAPCTAMVFMWSQLTNGDPNYTLVQVSINDLVMVFAFAPIAALLLKVNDVHVPVETLITSVILYVVLPLIGGVIVRNLLNRSGETGAIDRFLRAVKPWSVAGLLATVILLFGFQAETIFSRPQTIILIAIPLLLQTYGIFALAYGAARIIKLKHSIAAPACLIGTSNFFELAVAVSISLFGLSSGASLATVVGVLVEVPVMLSLVYVTNRTRRFFEWPD